MYEVILGYLLVNIMALNRNEMQISVVLKTRTAVGRLRLMCDKYDVLKNNCC